MHSLLLLTRIDKIMGDNDRRRLLKRVKAEAGGMFREVLPVSLLQAQKAGEDMDLLRESGLEAVLEALLQVIADLGPALGEDSAGAALKAPLESLATPTTAQANVRAIAPQAAPEPASDPSPVVELGIGRGTISEPVLAEPGRPDLAMDVIMEATDDPAPTPVAANTAAGAIMPRRVVLNREGRTPRPRPRRAESSGSLI